MIYVISDGIGHVKIGSAGNIEQRLKQLQTGNALPLKVLHTFHVARGYDTDLEFGLHARYAEYRIYNNNLKDCEWFFDACMKDLETLSEEDMGRIAQDYGKTGYVPEVHEWAVTVRQDTTAKIIEKQKKEIAKLNRKIERREAEIRKMQKMADNYAILEEKIAFLQDIVDQQHAMIENSGGKFKPSLRIL